MKEAYVGPSIEAPSLDWVTKAELLRLLALDEAQLTEGDFEAGSSWSS
jgi:hypothetical protein